MMTLYQSWKTLSVLLLACASLSVSGQPGAEHDAVVAKLLAGDWSRRGADTCLGCHDESAHFPTAAIFTNPHGQPAFAAGPFSASAAAQPPAGLQCEACHGPIGAHGEQMLAEGAVREPMLGFGDAATVSPEQQNAMCLGCHETYGRNNWHGSAHEQADLACADCHTLHSARDPVRERNEQVEVCATCHRDVAADFDKRSAHPVGDGLLACTDCHGPHGTGNDQLVAAPTLNETCYTCHAEKRGPFLFEHSPAAEDCSTCHTPHGSQQPALLVRRAPQLCQSCHTSVGHRSFAPLADGLPSGAASEYLLGRACLNCHTEVHGSNHPSGHQLRR